MVAAQPAAASYSPPGAKQWAPVGLPKRSMGRASHANTTPNVQMAEMGIASAKAELEAALAAEQAAKRPPRKPAAPRAPRERIPEELQVGGVGVLVMRTGSHYGGWDAEALAKAQLCDGCLRHPPNKHGTRAAAPCSAAASG